MSGVWTRASSPAIVECAECGLTLGAFGLRELRGRELEPDG